MAHGGQAARREQLNNFLGADFEDEGEEGSVHRVTDKYGSSDPWGACEGGLDGIVDILVSSNTDLVLPPLEEGDLPFAGLLMGDLVARSSLNNAQKSAVKTFIRLVRHPVLALYEEAFKMAAAESGGVHSKENEARERLVGHPSPRPRRLFVISLGRGGRFRPTGVLGRLSGSGAQPREIFKRFLCDFQAKLAYRTTYRTSLESSH